MPTSTVHLMNMLYQGQNQGGSIAIIVGAIVVVMIVIVGIVINRERK